MYQRNQKLIQNKFMEYLLPTILMSAAASLATIVDSVIVGNLLGSKALAAVGLSMPVIYGVNLLLLLFCVGGIASASIAKGRRENWTADQLFTASMAAALGTLTLFAVLALVFIEPITSVMARGDAELQALAAAYIRPISLVGIPLSISVGLAQFMRADGNPKASAAVMLVANGVNLVLDYVLIRFAGMGIAGAGLSTTLGYVVGVAVVAPYLFSKKRTFHFSWPGSELGKRLGTIVRVGLPKGLNHGMSLLRAAVLNGIILASLGPSGMSAMAVCTNALALASIFITGISDTLLPIVSTLFGEEDRYGIRSVVKTAGAISLSASCVIVLFLLAAPRVVGGWFGVTQTGDVAVLTPALRLYALSIPFFAVNQLLQNFYATTGREKLGSVMAVLDGFVFVAAFAALLAAVNPDMLWLCYLLAELCTIGVVALLGRRVRSKEQVNGILLLPGENQPGRMLDITIPATVEQAARVPEEVASFCIQNGLPPVGANRVGVAAGEMAVNTAQHGQGKKSGKILDIRVRATDERLSVTLRDNGVPFDPSTYTAEEETTYAAGGIQVARRLAGKVEYTHQLGFNTTVLTFDRKVLAGQG